MVCDRSDTESNANTDVKPGKRNYAIMLTNLFRKKCDKNAANAQTTDERKDGTGDDDAARSETTVVIEDETPKKVCNACHDVWYVHVAMATSAQYGGGKE